MLVDRLGGFLVSYSWFESGLRYLLVGWLVGLSVSCESCMWLR